jgi:hypothetical protein
MLNCTESSIYMYKYDVGPMYSHSKTNFYFSCFISFMGIYSPLYRHRFLYLYDIINLNLNN